MNYKCFILLFTYLLASQSVDAQRFLHSPIEGNYGKDYTLVNYVDWSFVGYLDAECGSKSYNGHEGTDFTIRSFRQMDSGVFVLAADSGVVTFIKDSLFDRETVSDTSKGLGNYIAIKHTNGYYSYYAHLKKHSMLVNVGDTVSAEQQIAQVGSSGNSSDPHLHFELWYDSLYVVDPFNGNCGNDSTLWINPLPYDTNLTIWDHGLYLKNININNLRERDSSKICCPYQVTNSSDTLTYWSQLYGLRLGDTLSIDWIDSSGTNQFTYDFVMQQDWWYYYFWSYITTNNLSLGTWQVQLSLNRAPIGSLNFEVSSPLPTSINESSLQAQECLPFSSYASSTLQNLILKDKVKVYNISGQAVNPNQLVKYDGFMNPKSSIYFIQIATDSMLCTYKVLK